MIPLFKVFVASNAAQAVAEVLRSGYIGEGPKTKLFEQKFSNLVQLPTSVVNSGTSAIDLVLHMEGIGPDTEVISTPVTCTATNGNIINRGAKIVWADVNPQTGLIDPDSVAQKITPRTRLIIGVNWGGSMPDYAALKSFNIPVLEDAAHGPYFSNKIRGDYIIWSFQAIKFLTTGDGGALFSPDPERARLLRWFGLDRESSADFRCAQNIQEIGYKYQLNDIAAGVGLCNIEYTAHLVAAQQRNAAYFHRELQNKHITLIPYDWHSTYWIYTILVDDTSRFTQYMHTKGIAVSPVHARNDKHDAFGGLQDLPGVNYFDSHQIAIPVGWWLTDADRVYIKDVVNAYGD